MCESVFFIGDMNEYIVSIQMILDEKQFKRIDKLMVQYIMRALQVPEI